MSFPQRVLDAVRGEAERRQRGGLLRRIFQPRWTWTAASGEPYAASLSTRFSRKAYMTAVWEAAEAMDEGQRMLFDHDGTLPESFWDDVERIAREWDSLPP